MTITINGSGTITGATTMASATSFSADVTLGGAGVEILNNSGRVVVGQAGSVLQVVSTVKTDTFSVATATFTDVTGLSVSITPSSSSSKILVMFGVAAGPSNASSQNLRLVRNSTVIYAGDAASNRPLGYASTYASSDYIVFPVGGSYLDSPATTSATTYKIQVASSGGTTTYVNRTVGDRDTTAYDLRGASSITVMEIAQ
jgi:hypothetical protein